MRLQSGRSSGISNTHKVNRILLYELHAKERPRLEDKVCKSSVWLGSWNPTSRECEWSQMCSRVCSQSWLSQQSLPVVDSPNKSSLPQNTFRHISSGSPIFLCVTFLKIPQEIVEEPIEQYCTYHVITALLPVGLLLLDRISSRFRMVLEQSSRIYEINIEESWWKECRRIWVRVKSTRPLSSTPRSLIDQRLRARI